MDSGELANKAGMLLKNRAMEEAMCFIAIAKPSAKPGEEPAHHNPSGGYASHKSESFQRAPAPTNVGVHWKWKPGRHGVRTVQ
jgi:hypothetical protein